MTDTTPFLFLARANQTMNERMNVILAANPHVFDQAVQGHYRSIHAIVDHSYIADNFWTTDVGFSIGAAGALDLDLVHYPQYGVVSFADFREYQAKRVLMDERLIRLVGLVATQWDTPIREFENPSAAGGEPVWKGLLHLFNHQTHHRGQISQILDSLGVANDYSSIYSIPTV